MHNNALRMLALTVIIVCTLVLQLSAEVTRLPPVAIQHVFPEDQQFFPGGKTWVDYRLYHDRPETEEFGTDFEVGSALSLFGSPRAVVRFIPRLLYQARQYRETANPFDFSPRNITTDLRITGAYRFDSFTAYGGWRHDCTHRIDTQGGRKPIHDGVVAGVEIEIPPLTLSPGSVVVGDVFLEGEYNVPSLFWDEATFIDQGKVTISTDVRLPTGELGTVFVNGYASYINRDPDQTITAGLKTHNTDWGIATGYRFHGTTGDLALYYRVERITDAWVARDVTPAVIQSIGAMIRM